MQRTGVNRTTIDAFNDSENFQNLPDQRELKCYMLCQLEAMSMIEPELARIDPAGVFENLEPLKPEHQDIFIRMGLKCMALKVPPNNDRCQAAYNWSVCLKKGDIHVSVSLIFRIHVKRTNDFCYFSITFYFEINGVDNKTQDFLCYSLLVYICIYIINNILSA